MNKYRWKIVMDNKNVYIVTHSESDIEKFISEALNPNTVNTYTLAESLISEEYDSNAVAIPSWKINSIEYLAG